jgi:hypothetical protein
MAAYAAKAPSRMAAYAAKASVPRHPMPRHEFCRSIPYGRLRRLPRPAGEARADAKNKELALFGEALRTCIEARPPPPLPPVLTGHVSSLLPY